MAQELQFIEQAAGRWFYLLEDRGAPKDGWDWRESAKAFGPFQTLEAAQEHEYESKSDTSGAEIVFLGDRALDIIALSLIAKAAR